MLWAHAEGSRSPVPQVKGFLEERMPKTLRERRSSAGDKEDVQGTAMRYPLRTGTQKEQKEQRVLHPAVRWRTGLGQGGAVTGRELTPPGCALRQGPRGGQDCRRI